MTPCCCVCGDDASTEEDIRVHITIRHVGYIPLQCHCCPRVFLPTLHSLTDHYTSVHPSEKQIAKAILSYDADKAAEVERLVVQSQANTNCESEPPSTTVVPKSATPESNSLKSSLETGLELANKWLSSVGKTSIVKTEQLLEAQENHRSESDEMATDETGLQKPSGSKSTNNTTDKHNKLESLAQEKCNRKRTLTLEYKKGEAEGPKSKRSKNHHHETAKNDKSEYEDDGPIQADGYRTTKDTTIIALESDEEEKEEEEDENGDESPLASPIGTTSSALNQLNCRQTSSDMSPAFLSGDTDSNSSARQSNGQFCQLCTKTVTNAWKHVWVKHMQTLRFHCNLCHYKTQATQLIKTHMWAAHAASRKEYVDRIDEHRDEYKASFTRAFPDTPAANKKRSATKPKCASTCALCGRGSLVDWLAKNMHIWRKHMPRDRFSCRRCPEIQVSRPVHIKYHAKRHHGGDLGVVVDAKLELGEQLAETRLRAFPTKTVDRFMTENV